MKRRPASRVSGLSPETPISRAYDRAKPIRPDPHALHAAVSRRAEGPPSGVGSRRPAREACALGPRVQGPVAVQQGEDAVLLRERPEAGLVRFLLRQERQHLRLRDGKRRRELSGSGRAPGADGRRAAAAGLARGRGARRAAQDAARRDGACREILPGHARLAQRRQGARLSRRPRARCRNAAQVPPRLRAGRALRAEGASRLARHSGRGHGRDGPADLRRRHPGAVRPFPRPRDVPDHRSARPRHRLRRPRARERCAGEISQLAGDAALPQGRNALQHRRRAPGRRTTARRSSRSKAMSTSSRW